jgi:dGTPase
MKDAINGLKDFLFDRVYEHTKVREHDHAIRRCLFGLLDTLLNEPKTYEHYVKTWVDDKNERLQGLVDYVAGMTDRYAVRIAGELLIPEPWPMEFT